MKNSLLIIGASGHGRVVADIALKMGCWQKINFLDDDEKLNESMGIKVIGKSSEALKHIENSEIFVAIGDNYKREIILKELEKAKACIPVLIHPNAVIGRQVKIGVGTAVMAGGIINCCTKIGKGCIINTGVTIDHDGIIEDYIHISPGAHLAGNVKVQKLTWIGLGSIVSNNVSITSKCIIGAGAVVINDVIVEGTYFGIPAKKK